jgi:Transposase DDE domain
MYAHLLDKFKNINPDWQEGMVKNTLLMVALILDRQTVCLWKLKGSVGKFLGNAETDSRSHYQRIKRWFKDGVKIKYLWLVLLEFSVGLLKKITDVLIIDGTSWQANGKTFHFLTLCLLYKGVAIPIWWIELGRMGISNQKQRKLLLIAVLKFLKLSGKILIGDREYIGLDWFKELKINKLGFVFRLRDNNYNEPINATGKSIEKLERKVKKHIGRVLIKPFEIDGQTYNFVITAYKNRSGKIEILRLITTLETPYKVVELYKLRYRIESFFKHLKSNGFQLEELNLKVAGRVKLMMALLVLAYTISVIYGIKGYKRKYPPLKHGSPAMSVFRVGLEICQNYLASFVLFLENIFELIQNVFKPKKHQLLLNVP